MSDMGALAPAWIVSLQRPFRSRSSVERYQAVALRRLIDHAWRRVPFYRGRMEAHGLRPADIRAPADLVRLPPVSRRELQETALADRMARIGEERVFILHRPTADAEPVECVYLSQRDVRELQFAKAAISTGWSLLLEELGLEHRDVQQVLLAGSFGSYLSPASAVRIGLVPRLPVLRIVAAGNVAGEGAKMALLSVRERAGARALLEEVTYVELSDRPEFNDRFVDQLGF